MKCDEESKLHTLAAAIYEMRVSSNENIDEEMFRKICREFDRTWFKAQSYYIQTDTCLLMVSIATTISPVLKKIRLVSLIVDEASQLIESASVTAISRFLAFFQKLNMI